MASEMMEALMVLCQERHIDPLYLIDRLEHSLADSYARVLKLEHGARVTIDRASGKIYVYKLVPLGEPDPETGEYAEFDEVDVTPANASRIAATHAKSEIKAIVRTAAKRQIFEEFSARIGDIITGTVLQSTSDFTIVKIRDGVEAELPHFDTNRNENERNERPAGERYAHNQRIKAVIIDVRDPDDESNPANISRTRPSIVISRSHPDLLRRLFELEVPEIYDGNVEVRSVARQAGVRSKVAVSSNSDRLDPVGACVGPKGQRVRNVVSELRGERIDVIAYNDDPAVFVSNALSPARVTNVIIDRENNYATVVVPDDQLSLAIGKEGQNARLAAKLTNMHIDIKSERLAGSLLQDMGDNLADDLVDEDDSPRCRYVSPSGVQCRNNARPGSHFCGIHEKMAAMGDIEVSDDPNSLV